MTKKSCTPSSKSRKPSLPPAHHDNESNVREGGLSGDATKKICERYHLTGDFEKDFVQLSSLIGTELNVNHRVKLPSTPVPSIESGFHKPKEDKKNVPELHREFDIEKASPVTYVISEKNNEYFKPRLDIETEWEFNKEYTKELYLRGWRVGSKIIEVMSKTMAEAEHLTVLNMWNVGLTDETIISLGKCLESSSSLRTLSLDGNNSVSGQHFFRSLNQTGLQNLSLRNCKLNETAAFYIGDYLMRNTTLLTLNVCFNKLADLGVQCLANSLRINRTLLSLNLGSNGISDQGVKYITDAISTFSLTHEEVVAKRMKRYEEKLTQESTSLDENPSSDVGHIQTEKLSKEKSIVKKTDSQRSKDSVSKRDKYIGDTSKSQKVTKEKSSSKLHRNKSPAQNLEDTFDFINPLLEETREFDGQLWIPGNRSLINLNLARNKITNAGVEMLYTAIRYQVDRAHQNNRVTGVGLLRLSLQGNCFPLDDPVYTALTTLMNIRDPLYKPPLNNSNEETK